ncbi:eukaryotic translation initiation factor 4B3-like [Macadamia integrifolia]|uniref:eukaryotic translation initiation factor 4B3-like n=1 Tax=Macadamia integrifolia TaxID=60698 RepID=UPI001C4EBC07|nr:eukaryotic translation initiation factor 4B3-like [Macadamia integrifolia]XP_042483915.1 eukaryotic translation initiation factor 4B3-like [Macadamia integrifolia]
MATDLSSAWSKPGKWALDSEEHEAELLEQPQQHQQKNTENGQFDFPSLAAAAATTKSKKKKGQTISLAEFSTGKPVGPGTGKAAQTTIQLNRLTTDELLILPTGPRERTAEELDRSRHGFRTYGLNDGSARNRYSNSDDSSNSKWGSSRVSDEPRKNGGFNRDSAPSRADEIDDWGATKKFTPAPASERRERAGFFDSQSKADESDSWVSKKSNTPSEGRRFGGGFENYRDRRGGFDAVLKETSNGGGAESDTWGRKKEEGTGGVSGPGRRRLVLQPRTLPVNDEDQQQPGSGSTTRSKGSNPFGEARPREEILAEKGQDWKKIGEQLESMKLKEMGSGIHDGPSLGKKSFESGNGRASQPEDQSERSWRKTDTDTDTDAVDVPTQSAGKTEEEEEEGVAEE